MTGNKILSPGTLSFLTALLLSFLSPFLSPFFLFPLPTNLSPSLHSVSPSYRATLRSTWSHHRDHIPTSYHRNILKLSRKKRSSLGEATGTMASMPDSVVSEQVFRRQINHVFLPPQLPPEDDTSNILDQSLMLGVQESLAAFGEALDCPQAPAIRQSLRMIQLMLDIRHSGDQLDPEKVKAAIRGLEDGGTCPFSVKTQPLWLPPCCNDAARDYATDNGFRLSSPSLAGPECGSADIGERR